VSPLRGSGFFGFGTHRLRGGLDSCAPPALGLGATVGFVAGLRFEGRTEITEGETKRARFIVPLQSEEFWRGL
jgi:hypothetical protein